MYKENEFDLYKDLKTRTNGEIYIGVVGPVRTGKSTFIKRFMDEMVLKNMEDGPDKNRLVDELPQSGTGKTITTTEPKFIPKDAAKISMSGQIDLQIRMVDCVGFMINGATGHMEGDHSRMVHTPWSEEEIPFQDAASIGTRKVIQDHSTVGVVVTTDGSITDIPRDSYLDAEKETINELKSLNKPFIVILNSLHPYSESTQNLMKEMEKEYSVIVLAMNCQQMSKDDIDLILKSLLYEFPVRKIEFYMNSWMNLLSNDHSLKKKLLDGIMKYIQDINTIKDIMAKNIQIDENEIDQCTIYHVGLENGIVQISIKFKDECYYTILSELTGDEIRNESDLINLLKDYGYMQKEYQKVLNAMEMVRGSGYSVVTPDRNEVILEKPEIIKHGSKYGVKIKASCPSIHFIKANVMTEISPIVGTEQQAKDLMDYITESQDDNNAIWDTNIFGKTVEQLVNDGISSKIAMIGEESQLQLQETMQKIVNESTGGLICIII